MITKNELKFIQSLKQTKCRKENNMFTVEGNKLVRELLSSDFRTEHILATDLWLEKYPSEAEELKHYEIISTKQMEQLSNMVSPPGIIAVAHTPSYTIKAEDCLNDYIIALDGINDPGNLGTIIRTADWFGIDKIICSQDCADAWQAKTIQSTMGSIFRIKIVETELKDFLSKVKTPIYGALMEGENIFTKKINEKKGVIIIGSESHGIRKDILPFVSSPIHIPRAKGSKTESLNAAVAASIIMAQLMK